MNLAFFKKPAFLWALGSTLFFAVAAGLLFREVWPLTTFLNAPDSPAFFNLRDRAYRLERLLAGDDAFAPYTLYWFLIHPFAAYELTFVFDTFLLMLAGVYALRGREIPWGPAWFGGFSIALSGYTFTLFNAGHRGYFHMFALACFAFGLLQRCFIRRQPFHFAMLGAVIGWGIGVQPDILLLLLFPLAAYALWLTFRETAPLRTMTRVWPLFLLSLLVLLLVSWSSVGKALNASVTMREEQIARSGGETPEARWRFATNWSLPKADALEFIVPGVYGNETQGEKPYWGKLGEVEGQWPNYRQHTVYLGVLTCFFACVALSFWKKRPACAADTPFWACVALVALALAFGRYTPAYRLFYLLPKMDLIRAPVKFLHITEWAIAMLAAIGLTQAMAETRTRRIFYIGGAFFALLIGARIFLPAAPSPELAQYAGINFLRSMVLCSAIVLILCLKRFWPGWVTAALFIALLTADQMTVAARYVHPVPLPAAYEDNPVVEAVLKAEPLASARVLNAVTPRVLPYEPLNASLAHHNIEVMNPTGDNDLGKQGFTFLIVSRAMYDQSFRGQPGAVKLLDFSVTSTRIARAQPGEKSLVLLHLPANRWILPENVTVVSRRCDNSVCDRFIVKKEKGAFVADVPYSADDEVRINGYRGRLENIGGRAAVYLDPGTYTIDFCRARQPLWLTLLPVQTALVLLGWALFRLRKKNA